jgi:GH35 family endo-1,4-beta-xylanase
MMEKIDFIDSCFQWAHNANPNAHLIINEFNVVANEKSRQQFYDVVKKLRDKKSPVSGLGIQVHEPNQGRYYYSPQQIWKTYETYSDFDLPLHVTELIPVSNGDSIKGNYKSGIWTEKTQAEFAEMVFTLSFGHPKMQSINWWGFSDKNIWQENGGLVDENLQPKEVYRTLDRLINTKWKTNLNNLSPNNKGKVEFRGFKGDYKIIVKKNSEIVKSTMLKYNADKDPVKIINLSQD